MTCAACKKRGKTWEGSEPTCAFESGTFSPDNWNCATASLVRNLTGELNATLPESVDFRYCDDQKYATIQLFENDTGALALWVSWYKSRGRTDRMLLLFSDQDPRPPTEAECLEIVERETSSREPVDG